MIILLINIYFYFKLLLINILSFKAFKRYFYLYQNISYKMKKNNNNNKKKEDKTDNSCNISNENSSERTIINKKSKKIEMIKDNGIINNTEESENKSNKEYDDITSINITDSKKSYNNESSSKKEGYKTLSQDIKNSMKKPLN